MKKNGLEPEQCKNGSYAHQSVNLIGYLVQFQRDRLTITSITIIIVFLIRWSFLLCSVQCTTTYSLLHVQNCINLFAHLETQHL